jgi:hypothetical protein
MFFLDCFDQRDAGHLIQRVAQALNHGGLWLLSEFAIPDRGWQHWHARIWVGTMYLFFRATTQLKVQSLPSVSRPFAEAGLRPVAGEDRYAGLIISKLYVYAPGRRSKSNY